MGSRILGTGSAFPSTTVSNQELARRLATQGIETSHEWILERTGIVERHLSQPGNPDEVNSSLGARAALRALEAAQKRPEDIDLIIYGTCTPDTQVPSTACWIQQKIGAKKAAGFDVNAACSGFLYAMHIAQQFLDNGTASVILVLGSDVLSSHTNWSDRTSCILFGDGAGAVVLERSPERSILRSRIASDGTQWELFHTVAGGSARPSTAADLAAGLDKMQMKGRDMFKVATRTMSDLASAVCRDAEVSPHHVDWVIPHQANLRIIEAVADRLELPMEKVLVTIDRAGNTSAATIPTTLDHGVRSGRIQRGQTLLMVAFGAGSTSAATLVRYV